MAKDKTGQEKVWEIEQRRKRRKNLKKTEPPKTENKKEEPKAEEKIEEVKQPKVENVDEPKVEKKIEEVKQPEPLKAEDDKQPEPPKEARPKEAEAPKPEQPKAAEPQRPAPRNRTYKKPAALNQVNGRVISKRKWSEDLPKEGETYKEYMRRLSRTKDITRDGVAGMIAASMMMKKNGGGNKPVDKKEVEALINKLQEQPAFEHMIEKSPDLGLLVANGAGSELCVRLSEHQKAYEKAMGPYMRPTDEETIEKYDTGWERRNSKGYDQRLYRKYEDYGKTKYVVQQRFEGQRPPSPEGCRSLVWEARNRINGPDNVPGGGKLSEDEFTVNMCLLNRYMPKKDFEKFCKELNEHRSVTQGLVRPEDFDLERMLGKKKKAQEFNRECEERLFKTWKEKKTLDVDALAEAAAIRELSNGTDGKLVRREEIDAMKEKLLAPGSAFQRTMQDVMKDKKTQEETLRKLNGTDGVGELAGSLRAEAKTHALRTAQFQINRSVRALAEGPSNTHLNQEHLATIIAAREFAAKKHDGTELLNNAAFEERTRQIQNDEAFKRLAERYNNDPQYRAQIKQSLKGDDTAQELQKDFMKIQNDMRKRQAERQEKERQKREQEQKEREEKQRQQKEKQRRQMEKQKQFKVEKAGSVQIEKTEAPTIQKQQAVSISF